MNVFPIFEFIYSAENECYSNRAEGGFMNQRELKIVVKVMVRI